jgi:hypothetical protein
MAANQTTHQDQRSAQSRGKTQSPQGNQGQPRREHERHDESGHEYGSMTESMSEMADQASQYVRETAEDAQECMMEHSTAAVVTALVGGFGIGLLIGHAIAMPRREPRSWRDRLTAEGIGRRLMERIESVIPDALAEHFGK